MNVTVAVLALLLARAEAPLSPPPAPQPPWPLDIVSDSECPAAAGIGEHLRRLFPEELFGAFSERVHVARGPASIKVELARADGTLVVERTLPAAVNDACARLAEAVAVVVVTWESELHPELLAMPTPPAASSAPTAVVQGAPPPQSPRAPGAPPPATIADAPSPAPVQSLVMAGLLGSLVGTDVSAGGRVLAVAGRAGARFGIQADLWTAGPRTVALGDGEVRWWRAGAAVGPAFRLERARWALVGALELALGFVRAAGAGYATNRAESTVLPGAVSGVAATVGGGAVFGWGSVRALAWPLAPRVRSVVLDDATVMPVERSIGWFEIDAALGLGVRF